MGGERKMEGNLVNELPEGWLDGRMFGLMDCFFDRGVLCLDVCMYVWMVS
jgi:hypothetical protein